MNVQTTRFGSTKVDENKIITFPAGLFGFGSFKKYFLLQPDDEGIFYWLQSVETPELAFVVTDPALWRDDYEVTIKREQIAELELERLDDAQVFVIVNKYDRKLTANLQGPLVINGRNHRAMHLVLADRKYGVRDEILNLDRKDAGYLDA